MRSEATDRRSNYCLQFPQTCYDSHVQNHSVHGGKSYVTESFTGSHYRRCFRLAYYRSDENGQLQYDLQLRSGFSRRYRRRIPWIAAWDRRTRLDRQYDLLGRRRMSVCLGLPEIHKKINWYNLHMRVILFLCAEKI